MSAPHTLVSSPKAQEVSEDLADKTTVRRRLIGILVGLILGTLVFYLFPTNGAEQISEAGRSAAEAAGKTYIDITEAMLRTVTAAVLMGVCWMTEAIPLAASAFLPLVLFPALQVATFKETAAPYASETILPVHGRIHAGPGNAHHLGDGLRADVQASAPGWRAKRKGGISLRFRPFLQ